MNNTIVPNESGSDFTVLPEPPPSVYVVVSSDGAAHSMHLARQMAAAEVKRLFRDPIDPWRVVRYVRAQ